MTKIKGSDVRLQQRLAPEDSGSRIYEGRPYKTDGVGARRGAGCLCGMSGREREKPLIAAVGGRVLDGNSASPRFDLWLNAQVEPI